MEEEDTPDPMSKVANALEKVTEALAKMGEKMADLGTKVESQETEIKRLKEQPISPIQPLSPIDEKELDSDEEARILLEKETRRRRNSYLAKVALDGEMDKKLSGSLEEQQVQLLHVQKNVVESMQVDNVSIPDAIRATEFQSIFVHQFGQKKGLIFFFKVGAHEEMCENEIRLGTDLSQFLNPSTIYTLSDATIMKVVARYVRSKYTIERDGLGRTIMGFTKTLKAKSPNWKFGILYFDRMLHPRLVVWIREMKKGWELLNIGATEGEKKTWPDERFGSKDHPHLLRIFAEGLGEFKDDFMRLMGEKKTKKMDSATDFFSELDAIGASMCDKSLQLRLDDALNREPTPLSKLREQVETPKYTRVAQRPTTVDSTTNFGRSEMKSVEFGKPGYPEMPKYGSSARDPTPRQSGFNNHTPRRIAALTGLDEDDSILDQNAVVVPERSFLQFPPAEEDEDDEESFGVNLSALMRGSSAPYPGAKSLYDPKAKAPADPTKPCFVHFRTGCDGRCGGYSHDEKLMEKKAYDQLEDLLTSRFGGRERTMRNMDKILAGMGATQASPGPYVKTYSSTKPRQALITGDPESHPGVLRPAGGDTETEATPADY